LLRAESEQASSVLDGSAAPSKASPRSDTKKSSARSAKSSAQIHEPQAGAGSAPHWDYRGENGPAAWGSLAPEFALCSAGQNQSPIDLQRVYTGSEPRLQFDYRPSKLRIVNNGHTIQVNYDPGSFLRIDKRSYELVQFHFHLPSEHTLKGQPFDMELHLVHKNAEGILAVVGVFLQRGAVSEGLQEVWEHLPGMAGEERSYQTVMVNAADLLPGNASYFLYSGSLTTPPCSEGVRWHVMATPLEFSEAQYIAFKRLFALNARPVQPLRERFVIQVTGGRQP
jgi:carbonic anhydrase